MHYARFITNTGFLRGSNFKMRNWMSVANIVTQQGSEKVCDFKLFGQEDTTIESIIVLNNQLNK